MGSEMCIRDSGNIETICDQLAGMKLETPTLIIVGEVAGLPEGEISTEN